VAGRQSCWSFRPPDWLSSATHKRAALCTAFCAHHRCTLAMFDPSHHPNQAVGQRRPAFGSVRPSQRRTSSVRIAAAAEEATTTSSSSPVPVLVWPTDDETIKDVFAFGGSAPEVRAFVSDGPELPGLACCGAHAATPMLHNAKADPHATSAQPKPDSA